MSKPPAQTWLLWRAPVHQSLVTPSRLSYLPQSKEDTGVYGPWLKTLLSASMHSYPYFVFSLVLSVFLGGSFNVCSYSLSLPGNSASYSTVPFWPGQPCVSNVAMVSPGLTTDQSRFKSQGQLAHRVLEITPSKTCILFSAICHTPGDTWGRHTELFL